MHSAEMELIRLDSGDVIATSTIKKGKPGYLYVENLGDYVQNNAEIWYNGEMLYGPGKTDTPNLETAIYNALRGNASELSGQGLAAAGAAGILMTALSYDAYDVKSDNLIINLIRQISSIGENTLNGSWEWNDEIVPHFERLQQ